MKPSVLAAVATIVPGTALAQPADRWDHPMMTWGGMGWLGTILWVVLVAAFVLLVLALAKRIGGDARKPASDPLAILKERLARGEIDLEEYEARRRAIEG